ncbi:MAG: DUF1592 domain-containing protein [Myxococcaceae bacterium]|nr:DUF1592 domain-containing protein [Myxococcaceae bacterium]MCA3016150.1 DUF1592 domain-containing protein [Myxococcaceae bacterium]
MVRWLAFGLVVAGCEGALEGGLGVVPSGAPGVGVEAGPASSPGAAPVAACAPPSQLDPGRVTLRRLNRFEYDNTVRDLLDDTTRPARAFPADDFGHGFDNLADVLSTAPVLVEQYERAARALAEAIVEREAAPGQTTRVEAEDGVKSTGAPLGAFWNLYTNGSVSSMVTFGTTARYTFRVQAAQTRAGSEAATMVLSLDGRALGSFSVTATQASPATYSVSADVSAGPHRVAVEFTNDFYEPPNDRNLLVDWVEVQRPAAVVVPATAKVMVCDLATGGGGCVRSIVSRFGRRAWRRPLTTAEVDRLANVVTLAQAEGEPVHAGVAMALTALLLSPHFLYRVELDPDPTSPAPHPLTDHELAARLSYFLWASTPDEALARAADDGTLSQPAQLSAQVQRMLGDAKARSLVTRFAGQWLWTNQVEDAVPSTSVYANVTAATKTAMRLETEAVVEHFFTRDESVLGLLGSDFTFVNDTLADHYGLARPGAATPQRVAVAPSTERGSVLGHAGLLTVTSFPTRTSPVKRGAWVLSNLLCQEPPAPPPGVEGLPPPDLANATLRQRVEAHRANPACAGCHALMDPIGFGLERFDGVGRARATDTGGAPLDVAGVLPDGRSFSGPRELSALLKADPRVPHCLAEKLFTYGLGRAPARDEKCQVDAITSRFEAGGHRFSALVQAIVSSPSFTHRRGELP